jgi:glycogen synthase
MRVLRLCSVHGAAGPLPHPNGYDVVGGMQVHTERLTTELSARGLKQIVVTAYRPDRPRVEQLNARTTIVRTGIAIRRFRQLFGIASVPRVARLERVDLVHVHLGEDIAVMPLARFAAARFSAPVVATVHCSLDHTLMVHDARSAILRRVGGPMQNRVLREAGMVLVLSEGLERRLVDAGISSSRVRVIPVGIDLAGSSPSRPSWMGERRWIAYVGRLVREKGVHDLLDAFQRIPTEGLGLVFIGDGPERSVLEATGRPADDRVRFTGVVPHAEVSGYLAHADVVAVPSWYEERGRVVLEAMAVGTPVIATGVGGIVATVRDGENGLLVPPRSPGALARAIDWILRERVRAVSMGHAGKDTAREHGMDALVDATLNAYTSVLETAGDAGVKTGRPVLS